MFHFFLDLITPSSKTDKSKKKKLKNSFKKIQNSFEHIAVKIKTAVKFLTNSSYS